MRNLENIFSLKDKYVLITGAAGLLGLKHAEAVALAGGNPILTDISDEILSQIAESLSLTYNIKCLSFKMDITLEADVFRVYDLLKKINIHIDILINNAARNPKVENNGDRLSNRLESLDLKEWEQDISVGLTGALICSKVFGSCMASRKSGNIINVSSDLGIIAPDQRLYKKENLLENEQNVKPVSYSVVKHGILGLTKYLATYWPEKNVRCNAISPGGIYNGQSENFLQKIQDRIPIGRMARSDEYQGAIIFLCSNSSSYMTGANLIIDGGRSIW